MIFSWVKKHDFPILLGYEILFSRHRRHFYRFRRHFPPNVICFQQLGIRGKWGRRNNNESKFRGKFAMHNEGKSNSTFLKSIRLIYISRSRLNFREGQCTSPITLYNSNRNKCRGKDFFIRVKINKLHFSRNLSDSSIPQDCISCFKANSSFLQIWFLILFHYLPGPKNILVLYSTRQ